MTCCKLAIAIMYCLMILSSAVSGSEEKFIFTVTASQHEVKIAEPVRLAFTAHIPTGWELAPPLLPEDFGDLHLINSTESTSHLAEQTIWTQQLILEGYAGGEHRVPAITLLLYSLPLNGEPQPGQPTSAQRVRQLTSNPLLIQVRSSRSSFLGGNKLRPIYNQVSLPWTWRRTLGTILVLICIALSIWLVRKFVESLQKRATSHRRLQNDLAQLNDDWLRNKITNSATLVELVVLLKQWLYTRDPGLQVERTTTEWKHHLQTQPDNSLNIESVATTIFALADRMNYVGIPPSTSDLHSCFQETRRLFAEAGDEISDVSTVKTFTSIPRESGSGP
ncbi:hypothetical protein Pla110_25130 [Polystyrenella longa]|uniref:Protein BatD n=1 Tax=Polystyrenella longa TaxID=2528007 RepID=A0A518CNJ3_9PLAN|nr:DUF4381 family protein [Polystyrenella longa]QDU80778.1 hypothetical protein Pla110_25130 [Polystyrenella longa]